MGDISKFRQYDVDRSGAIGIRDFFSALEHSNIRMPQTQKEQLIRHFDTYGDGTVDYRAYVDHVNELTQSRRSSSRKTGKTSSQRSEATKKTRSPMLPGPVTTETGYMEFPNAWDRSASNNTVLEKSRRKILNRAKEIPRFVRACDNMDHDSDRCLTHDEFGRVLSRMGVSMGRTTFEKITAALDAENSGVIPIERVENFLNTPTNSSGPNPIADKENVEHAYSNLLDCSEIRKSASVDPVYRHLNSLDKGQTGKLPLMTMTYALQQHGFVPNSRYMDIALRHLNVDTKDPNSLVPYRSFMNSIQRKLNQGSIGAEGYGGENDGIDSGSPYFRQEGIHDSKIWQSVRSSRDKIASNLRRYPGKKLSYKEMDRCLVDSGVHLSDEDVSRVIAKLDHNDDGKISFDSVMRNLYPGQSTAKLGTNGVVTNGFQDDITGEQPWWINKSSFSDSGFSTGRHHFRRAESPSPAHLPHMTGEYKENRSNTRQQRKQETHTKLFGSDNVAEALAGHGNSQSGEQRSRSRSRKGTRMLTSHFAGGSMAFPHQAVPRSESAKIPNRPSFSRETQPSKGTYSFAQPNLTAGTGVDEKRQVLLDLYRQNGRGNSQFSDGSATKSMDESHDRVNGHSGGRAARPPVHPGKSSGNYKVLRFTHAPA